MKARCSSRASFFQQPSFGRFRRLGCTLLELIFVMAISSVVMGVGCQIYISALRNDDIERARETATLTAQNAMGRIKSDMRNASSLYITHDGLTIKGKTGSILYRSTRAGGVERVIGRSRVMFKDVTAKFTAGEGGVSIVLRSSQKIHRRPIRIEISSFVSPRNS